MAYEIILFFCLVKNFKNGVNNDVFSSTTKEEWEESDSEGEIKQFIESVYKKI